MKHYVYKLIDPITNEFYFGSRSCSCEINNDEYMGSYTAWKPEDETRLEKSIIKEWESARQASISLGIHNITSCCMGKLRTSGGFIWKYKKQDNDLCINS